MGSKKSLKSGCHRHSRGSTVEPMMELAMSKREMVCVSAGIEPRSGWCSSNSLCQQQLASILEYWLNTSDEQKTKQKHKPLIFSLSKDLMTAWKPKRSQFGVPSSSLERLQTEQVQSCMPKYNELSLGQHPECKLRSCADLAKAEHSKVEGLIWSDDHGFSEFFPCFFHWVPTLSGFPRMELGNICGNVGPILLSDLASASKSCQILLESRWDELNAVSSMGFSKPWESGCQNTIPGVSQSKCHYGSGCAANVGQSSGKRQYFKSPSDDGAILEGNGHLAARRKNLFFVGHWLFVASLLCGSRLIHPLN